MKKLKMFKKSEQYKFALEAFILYILNLIDLIFTQIALSTGKVFEANPLMVNLMANLPMAIFVKGVILGFALFLIVFLTYKWNIKILKFVHILIIGVICIYILVNINHIVNFILIFWR